MNLAKAFTWLAITAAASAFGTGCITARVLVSPDHRFDPSSDGVDAVLSLGYLTLAVGVGAALGHNAEADDPDERATNRIRGGLLGLSLGLPLLVGMDYFFARSVSPLSFGGPLLEAIETPVKHGLPPRRGQEEAFERRRLLPVTLLDFMIEVERGGRVSGGETSEEKGCS